MQCESRTIRRRIRLGGWIAVGCLVLNLIACVIQFLELYKRTTGWIWEIPRIRGLFGLPSSLTLFVLSALSISWSAFGRKQGWGRQLVIILCILNLPILLNARSLALFSFVLPVLGVFVWQKASLRTRPRVPLFILGGLVLAMGMGGLFFYVRGAHAVMNLRNRVMNWRIASAIGMEHLPWGAGTFTYWTRYRSYRPAGANETRVAHSLPLQAFAEWGVPACLFYTGLLIVIAVGCILILQQDSRRVWWVMPALGILADNVVDVGLFDRQFLGMAVLMLILPFLVFGSPFNRRMTRVLLATSLVLGVPLWVRIETLPAFYKGKKPSSRVPQGPAIQNHDGRYSIENVRSICTTDLTHLAYDVRTLRFCGEWCLRQHSFKTAGWFGYHGIQAAPHNTMMRQFWHSWKEQAGWTDGPVE